MSIEHKQRTKILTDIHSIFDLRQSKIAMLGDVEKTKDYLVSEEYNFRQIDNFSSVIDMDRYNKYYDIKELLMYTTVTYVLALIKMKIDSLEKINNLKSSFSIAEVVINTYPYTLSEKLKNVLQNAIFVKLGKSCYVELICLAPKEITPLYITNTGINYMYMYDYSDWLNANSDAMDKVPMTSVVMYFPALYKVNPTEVDIKKLSMTGFKDFFSYVEYLYSYRTSLKFLPVLMYSNELIASGFLEKMNVKIKESSQKEITEFLNKGGFDGNISSKIQVP